jgi:8-oxo-dGTP pyrophosphatase MutT (NUDIX family)
MKDELLDIIDEDNRVVGQASKSTVHRQGLRHRVGAVLLRRKDGKYLIPTASSIKAEAGRLYHSAAGHVLSGEPYADCAKRELLEETGIEATNLEYLGTYWFERDYPTRKERERFEVYGSVYLDGLGPVKLNEEQVDEKWLSLEELRDIHETRGDLVSLPLKMTCKVIFNMDEGKMSQNVTVYFGCSMLGGYANVKRENLAEFPKMIVELGHRLATDHQTQPGILEKEAQFEHVYIHDRDYRWMMESDIGVFEISNPSLGVGGEISDMIHMGKPVLLLFKKGLEEKVSAYIRGKCGSSFIKSPLECAAYESLKEARELIRRFIDLCRAGF